MRSLVPVLALLFSVGCSHTVAFKSEPPGVDVYLDKKKIGTTPFTYQETSGSKDPITVVAKQHGVEKVITLQRDQANPMVLGAGAGVGAGACAVLFGAGCVASVIPFVNFFSWGLGCLGCLAIPGGAVGAYFLYGNQLPDTVDIKMKGTDPGAPASKPAGSGPPKPSIY